MTAPRLFELVAVLGRGGFGKVMQVRHRATRGVFAMKVFRKARGTVSLLVVVVFCCVCVCALRFLFGAVVFSIWSFFVVGVCVPRFLFPVSRFTHGTGRHQHKNKQKNTKSTRVQKHKTTKPHACRPPCRLMCPELTQAELQRRNQVERTRTERELLGSDATRHPYIVQLRYAFQVRFVRFGAEMMMVPSRRGTRSLAGSISRRVHTTRPQRATSSRRAALRALVDDTRFREEGERTTRLARGRKRE